MQYAINIIPKLQMNPNTVRLWLQRGDIEKLENVVLEGRGTRLLGEHSPDLRTRVFLKGLPNYLTRIGEIHDATIRGSLSEVERLVSDEPRKQLAISKDASGIPLIHKAVYHDHRDIVAWLVKNYPLTSEQKDREGRTALHYCAACTKPGLVWDILTRGGCDASICDNSGNPAAYYLEHKVEIELPWPETMTSRKLSTVKENLEFKPSNIRIWIHNRDIGKLQQVLWEGHGAKLRCETSSNPRVKRFLEAVPFIMGTVKDIHAAVVKNDVETFRKKTNKPVSPLILCSRDNNGLNVLHKASGLGYTGIVHEILAKYPAALTVQDCEGKTPLHYSAVLKDDGAMYALLVANGADENKQDNRQKTPAYYKNRPTEIDVTNLVVVPEAPRVSGSTYPKNWDWRILEAGESGQRQVKRTVRNVDILDRAFGSAEIPSNNCQEAIGTFENDSGGNRKDDLEERIKIAHDKLESKVASLSPVSTESKLRTGEPPEVEVDREPESQAEPDTERETRVIEPTMDQDSEEDSADDDVIVKHSPGIIEGEDDGEHAAKAKYCTGNHPARDDAPDELTNHRHDEKFEPITGEAESNDAVFEDDQVIVGEHEELGEAELNDGSSTTIDPEVEDLVEHGNMEQLAAMVLNGDGRRLVGRHSNNGELQAFIDNVPAYMGKIHAVHIAAREGNLRDLQGALDRRKFAVARDGSSPNGATPLHIAIIFGHTGVIRYLAGRFSETAHAVDRNGRTPLHYAATLADNGHYYSLLLHLGANPLIQDNFGRRAEYYKTNQDDFSHKMLLRDFGAHETIADQMLSDKVPGGDSYSARRDVTETETLATLERCFRLLAGARRGSTASTPTNGSASTLLGRYLKRPVFELLKHRLTRLDHNLFDLIWPALRKCSNGNHSVESIGGPESPNGTIGQQRSQAILEDDDCGGFLVIPDYESYVVFAELLEPLIRDIHCVTATGDIPDHPDSHFFDLYQPSKIADGDVRNRNTVATVESFDLDPVSEHTLAGVVECSRNLRAYALPLNLTLGELKESEKEITGALLRQETANLMAEGSSEDEGGSYYTLNEVLENPSQVRARLAAAGLLLPLLSFHPTNNDRRLHGKHWPNGRGVFVAAAGDLAAWVNVQDHLRLICCMPGDKPGLIGKAYARLGRVTMALDSGLVFKRDKKFGFLTSRPTAIGNTLQFSLVMKFPELSKEPGTLWHLCLVRGLNIRDGMRKDTVRIGNRQCLGVTELQTLQDFCRAVLNILSLEKELAHNNSMRIASLVANIFRKRITNSRSFHAHN
ncbi:uncharacterized protein LOC105688504 isoform X1 [Athalia rosae]|uniref:uncharacterized protein LOC105688504 isoform X1 n=1 Tax=Athalia rosae TaxID=37344 RepID=UPI0020332B06|nr:uncharacterized protein LOC105688504 isoform X1 [Athalia rosae]